MSKQSKITNLLVMPLIASAVLFASPAIASNPAQSGHSEIRNVTTQEGSGGASDTKKGVAGSVTSISGNIIVVTTKSNVNYTVDASHATIMKAGADSNTNPSIVTITDIKVGDAIMVRGVITNTEIAADKIFDGKMPTKHGKKMGHLIGKKMHTIAKTPKAS